MGKMQWDRELAMNISEEVYCRVCEKASFFFWSWRQHVQSTRCAHDLPSVNMVPGSCKKAHITTFPPVLAWWWSAVLLPNTICATTSQRVQVWPHLTRKQDVLPVFSHHFQIFFFSTIKTIFNIFFCFLLLPSGVLCSECEWDLI